MSNTVDEKVRVAINSFEAGMIDKKEAVKMVTDICREAVISIYDLMTAIEQVITLENFKTAIEQVIEEERLRSLQYPLDDITIGEAMNLYHGRRVIFRCEDGHVMGMYLQRAAV